MFRPSSVLVLLLVFCAAFAARLPREADAVADPAPVAAPAPVADPAPEADPSPDADPAPVADPVPEAKSEDKLEPSREAKSDKTDKSEPKSEGKSDSSKSKQSIYTSRFDSIDLDQILSSERLLNNYFKCLMETGRCTPDAAELRRLLPDALETECSKCTEKQREGSEKVLEHIIKNKPEQWKQLQAKYDPDGKYKSKYQKLAEEKGIKVDE